jgi:hypothetical protein
LDEQQLKKFEVELGDGMRATAVEAHLEQLGAAAESLMLTLPTTYRSSSHEQVILSLVIKVHETSRMFRVAVHIWSVHCSFAMFATNIQSIFAIH